MTAEVADPTKAMLAKAHPNWSIVHTDVGRWWAFLDPKLRRRDSDPTQIVDVDADSPEELDAKLAAAGS
ncbi:hypothetical protein [Actinomadura meridiana]